MIKIQNVDDDDTTGTDSKKQGIEGLWPKQLPPEPQRGKNAKNPLKLFLLGGISIGIAGIDVDDD